MINLSTSKFIYLYFLREIQSKYIISKLSLVIVDNIICYVIT